MPDKRKPVHPGHVQEGVEQVSKEGMERIQGGLYDSPGDDIFVATPGLTSPIFLLRGGFDPNVVSIDKASPK